MKINVALLACAASIVLAACGDNHEETTSAESQMNSTTSTESTINSEASATVNSSFDENGSYVNLQNKKPVKVKKGTSGLVDYETNEPISYFFYNPSTKDTFDRWGNLVNTYLITGADGTYTVDEKRWKTKIDEDGDIKMKDGDESKIKMDASSGNVKIKTADTTIKQK